MNIAVIGAGIGGMAAAYDLVKAGHKVTIYEAAGNVGGLAAGFKDPAWDWSVERFYHHWFTSDRDMMGLIDELGWREKVIVRRPLTVMFYKDKFYPFDSYLSALLYPGLGYGINKIRFGLVGVYLRLTQNWRPLEHHTVDAWMRKWAGNQVYEQMWEPMVVGKFGERYARVINMAWMWARFHSRTTRLATFEGGFQAFSDALADKLREMGVTLSLNTPVSRISPRAGGGLTVTLGESSTVTYDQVLSTTSPALMAQMTPDLPPAYLKGLLDLKSMGAVVMVLALKQSLSPQGYYWYNIPKSSGFPFLSLVEHTNFLPKEKFGGETIVYIGDYLEPDHEHFRMDKEEILKRFIPAVARINPEFKADWIRQSWLFRTSYAQPIPQVDHSRTIPAIQTPLPGLYFASMSQVYPWDRGTNYAVEISRRAARDMLVGNPGKK